jgi:hypothetical protein
MKSTIERLTSLALKFSENEPFSIQPTQEVGNLEKNLVMEEKELVTSTIEKRDILTQIDEEQSPPKIAYELVRYSLLKW